MCNEGRGLPRLKGFLTLKVTSEPTFQVHENIACADPCMSPHGFIDVPIGFLFLKPAVYACTTMSDLIATDCLSLNDAVTLRAGKTFPWSRRSNLGSRHRIVRCSITAGSAEHRGRSGSGRCPDEFNSSAAPVDLVSRQHSPDNTGQLPHCRSYGFPVGHLLLHPPIELRQGGVRIV